MLRYARNTMPLRLNEHRRPSENSDLPVPSHDETLNSNGASSPHPRHPIQSDPVRTVGVLSHPLRPNTEPLAERIARSLRDHGVEVWLHTEWDADEVHPDVEGSDMVVAIGGDGAMLKAARVCAPHDVPVLGINMGRLGFLTEVQQPDNWEDCVPALLEGRYWVEPRFMLTASAELDGTTLFRGNALNEVLISGAGIGHMVQLDLYIDSNWTTTYNCDSLIVATPTGSTAYALSVGGPILPPDLQNILVVPSAAHLSMRRAIVLSEGASVAIRPIPDNRGSIQVIVDGVDLGQTSNDAIIHVRACDYAARFVRLRQRNYFYRSLLDKLEPRINRDAPSRPLQLDGARSD